MKNDAKTTTCKRTKRARLYYATIWHAKKAEKAEKLEQKRALIALVTYTPIHKLG